MEDSIQINKTLAWIQAFRLRTLPLAFSCIFAGTGVAVAQGVWEPRVFIFALATTLFLQVLSNLANDFGDSQNGADNEGRIGPKRSVQSGSISPSKMKRAIIINAILAFSSGATLIYFAFGKDNFPALMLFLVIGLLAIAAAIKYTVGSSPYGYRGLGDFFVFLFFGIIGVSGVYYLYTEKLDPVIFLPAITVGSWASAVLNLNNLRDHENDAKVGKRTIVVKMGFNNARKYHLLLIVLGWGAAIAYLSIHFNFFLLLSLLPMALHVPHLLKLFRTNDPAALDPELKKIALSTFAYSLILFLSAFYQ